MPATTVEDPFVQKPVPNTFDSGYFGSQFATQQMEATQQTEAATQANDLIEIPHTPQPSPPKSQATHTSEDEDIVMDGSPEPEERRSTEGSFQSAKEEQTKNVTVDAAQDLEAEVEIEESPLREVAYPVLSSPLESRIQRPPSPEKRSPERPTLPSPPKVAQMIEQSPPVVDDEHMEDIQSPSDGSSPIGPIVRKSSLNFASLPAREPITTKKSIGNRVSRTSQLEQSRTSNYGRQTGGKSLGNVKQDEIDHEEEDEMDVDEPEQQDPMSRLHNKTSTQRLQDQISMLGKSQSTNRPAKSLANNATTITNPVQPIQAVPTPAPTVKETVQKSPQRQSPQRKPFLAPGAFPDDEDDSWIGPPNASGTAPSIFSPRPQITKSHTTDVMENIHGKNSIGGDQFSIPKRGEEAKHRSPLREPAIPERTTSTLGHTKSVSTSIIRSPKKAGELPELTKGISVSNPNPSIGSNEGATTPPKSPSRSFKGSPIKAAKDKFSSVLKMSRGLFASSAAVSADAKTSTISPASSRMGLRPQPSFEEALQCQSYISQEDFAKSQYSQRTIDSPGKSNVRKTRASTEKEERRKQEEAAREAREAKEAQKMAEQLEKARQKVKEEARVYHQEQERVATMQKEVNARKEQEKLAKASQVDIPRATRTSPRKTKAQLEAEGIAAAAASTESLSNKDIEMTDASSMPPPAVPRPKSQIGRPAAKRPLKPAKETASKAKPPTVIRVDTGSQRGHVGHQYHPSTSTLASTLQESLAAPPQAGPVPGQLRKQASTSSMQSTSSRTGFKSAATKALEAAAKKKEQVSTIMRHITFTNTFQDELAAQRKREAKQEIERQRAANKEEEKRKEEQQRRQDLERQRTIQREKEQAAAAADAKRNAARQATEKKRLEMEKAKMNGAPPPAIRPQASGADLTLAMLNDKPLPVPPRGDVGPSTGRMNHPSTHRPQGDSSRPTNASIYTAAKVPPKRPLQQEAGDEYRSRPTMPRNPPSYQHNDNHSKRRKTSDVFDSDDEMSPPPAKLTAPPIRQSSSRPKVSHGESLPCTKLIVCRKHIQNLYSPSQMATVMLHSQTICKSQLLLLNTTWPSRCTHWIWHRSRRHQFHLHLTRTKAMLSIRRRLDQAPLTMAASLPNQASRLQDTKTGRILISLKSPPMRMTTTAPTRTQPPRERKRSRQ